MLALLAVALVAVNLYVQSEGTQARIQQELSQRLGATLRIERISVTPWWGLKLTGITMPQSDPSVQGDFLRADTFRLRIRFLSLFSRQLIIKEVSLVHPTVLWSQNASGKWRLPTMRDAQQETPAAAPASEPRATVAPDSVGAEPSQSPVARDPVEPATAATSPAGPITPSPPGPATTTGFTPEVRRVTLRNGTFRFLDARGKPVATFEDVDFRSSLRSGTALRGNASIAKISLRNRFFLEQLESPLRYDPAALEFSQISARAGGGEITGFYSMNPAEPGSPFDVNVKFRDVQADRVVSDAGGPPGMVKGRIEGELEAAGKTADPNALAGVGEIYLRDGEVRQYSLLVALGQLLQIDELRQLRFDEAHVKYHIAPGVVTIDEMLFSSANIRLSATGTITFAGKMRLESQLAITEAIRDRLFSVIRTNFQPSEPPGYSAVHFQVRGTVDRPKTNLMDKIVGGQLNDLGGVIEGLLGGKKKSKRPKKGEPADQQSQQPHQPQEGAPSPSGTEAASPGPASSPSP